MFVTGYLCQMDPFGGLFPAVYMMFVLADFDSSAIEIGWNVTG